MNRVIEMLKEYWLQLTAGTIGGVVSGLFGGFDAMFWFLAIIMALDYISGVIVAGMNKSKKSEHGGLDSKIGFRGICKKAIIFLVVILSVVLDGFIGGDKAIFKTMTMVFYIVNEAISVLENAAIAEVGLPPKMLEKLKDVLDQGKEKEEPEDVKEE